MNTIDELCLRNRKALEVYFMREGFEPKDSEDLAAACFTSPGSGGFPDEIKQGTTMQRVSDAIRCKIEMLKKSKSEYEDTARRIGLATVKLEEIHAYVQTLEPVAA